MEGQTKVLPWPKPLIEGMPPPEALPHNFVSCCTGGGSFPNAGLDSTMAASEAPYFENALALVLHPTRKSSKVDKRSPQLYYVSKMECFLSFKLGPGMEEF
jgi:hypothetical protein